MADITDVQAVKFANERVRPLADRLAQSYAICKAIVAVWTAQGLSASFPNDTSEVIDNARQDGRPVITGAMVNSAVAFAQSLIADYEANSSAKLNGILRIAVNPNP